MSVVVTESNARGDPVAVKRGNIEFRAGTRVTCRGEVGTIERFMLLSRRHANDAPRIGTCVYTPDLDLDLYAYMHELELA